jgi:hypothetical protein
LEQEIVFRTATQLAVQENDLHAHPLALIDQQDLIGIFAGEAIRRMHIEAIDRARRHQITQTFEGRADEGRPAIAFIQKLHHFG